MAPRSHLTTRLIGMWYGLVWLLILAAVVYGLARGFSLTSAPVAAALGALLIVSILAFRTATQLFACFALMTLAVPLYLFEIYLMLTTSKSPIVQVATLRGQGLAAYPAVFPSGFLYLWQRAREPSRSPIIIEGRELLPLAGIPDVLTIYCPTQNLSWVTFHSDAFGFRNPDIAAPRAALQFALLGDSFVEGFCVPDALTYATQLSLLGPTASYGMNATSALAQLAIYREYVKALRPRHIIWFFYEGNDLQEYLAERTWPLLRAYLDPKHFQDLVGMNGPISEALKLFIDQQLASEDVATVVHDPRPHSRFLYDMLDLLLLRRARAVLRFLWERPVAFTLPALTETEWGEISKIWREVIETQRGQGGQITFVYVPAPFHFLAKDAAAFQALERKVLALWSSLGVDNVALTKTLEATRNPLAYYEQGGIHFNEQGYRLTAEAIIEYLRRTAGG
jgi:hypothetical protein